MKTLLWIAASLALASLAFEDVARAHGGTYRGPGNTVPPGGSGGGSGGSSGSGGSGSNTGPSAPANPGGGGSGKSGQGSGASGTSAAGPGVPSAASAPASASWEPWWAFNRDPFLNLKAVIHDGDLLLGSDDFFLGHAPLDLARDRLRPSEEVVRKRIVPALRKVLSGETDNDIVTGALVALAKIGSDPAAPDGGGTAPVLRSFLSSANQEIAETAAVSLGILADPEEIDVLESLLFDSPHGRELVGGHEVNWRTRAFAAYGLGLIAYRAEDDAVRRRVVGSLAEVLEGPALEMATPDVAVGCSIGIGLVPLPVDPSCLRPADESPQPTHCRRCQVEWMIDFSRRPGGNYLVRAHTPTVLTRLVVGGDSDVGLKRLVADELLKLVRGGDKVQRDLRTSAVSALGAIGETDGDPIDREIVAALKRLATDSREPSSRTMAWIALGQAGGRRGSATGTDSETLTEVRRFLRDGLRDGRSTDRAWIVLAMSLLERGAGDAGFSISEENGRALRSLLAATRSPGDVGACAVALGVMRDVDSAGALIRTLEDNSDDRARGYLCIGLGLMNARQSVEPLRRLLVHSRYRPLLLREVAISLGLLGDKGLVDDLVDQLHGATGLTAQSAIAAALGSIGDARSVDPLLEMLDDPEVNVRARAFAAVALGIVADKEPLPWNAKIAIGLNYRAGTPTLTDGRGGGILDIL